MNSHTTRIVRCIKDSDGAERAGFTCTCYHDGRAWWALNIDHARVMAEDHEAIPALHDYTNADIVPRSWAAPAIEWAECTGAEFVEAREIFDGPLSDRPAVRATRLPGDAWWTYEVDAEWLVKRRGAL